MTNQDKHSASIVNNEPSTRNGIELVTETLDGILVGASENLILIIKEADTLTNQIKH